MQVVSSFHCCEIVGAIFHSICGAWSRLHSLWFHYLLSISIVSRYPLALFTLDPPLARAPSPSEFLFGFVFECCLLLSHVDFLHKIFFMPNFVLVKLVTGFHLFSLFVFFVFLVLLRTKEIIVIIFFCCYLHLLLVVDMNLDTILKCHQRRINSIAFTYFFSILLYFTPNKCDYKRYEADKLYVSRPNTVFNTNLFTSNR